MTFVTRLVKRPGFWKRCLVTSSVRSAATTTTDGTSRERMLSFIYENNESKINDLVNEMSSGLAPSKSKLVHLNLASHLIASGRTNEGLKVLHLTKPTRQLTDDQFISYVERIFLSKKLENDQIKQAESFYTQIIKAGFHNKRNRDAIIAKFLQNVIRLSAESHKDLNVRNLMEYYTRLAAIEPLAITEKEEQNRQKIHPLCLWTIICFAHSNSVKDSNSVHEYVKSNGSSVQRDCYSGLWMLYGGKPLEFVDFLTVNGNGLTGNHVEYLMVVSEVCKEPKFLESLINYPEQFKKPEQLVKACEMIALICGKNGDFDGLERLFRRIMRVYKAHPEKYHVSIFRKAIHRIAHFYRCNNTVPFPALSDTLKTFW